MKPVLLYGSEVWTETKLSEKKLVVFENKILIFWGLSKEI